MMDQVNHGLVGPELMRQQQKYPFLLAVLFAFVSRSAPC
jgi:hypothetical protein